LASDEALFESLPADKAAAGLIQAARAIDQHEKIAGDRKKKAAAARQAVILELREALKKRPELREEIEKLIG
jgi:hypothetical protein